MLHLDPPRLPRRPDSGTARWAVVSVLPGSCADDAILDIELVAAFMSMVDLPGLHAAGNIAFTERAFVVVPRLPEVVILTTLKIKCLRLRHVFALRHICSSTTPKCVKMRI